MEGQWLFCFDLRTCTISDQMTLCTVSHHLPAPNPRIWLIGLETAASARMRSIVIVKNDAWNEDHHYEQLWLRVLEHKFAIPLRIEEAWPAWPWISLDTSRWEREDGKNALAIALSAQFMPDIQFNRGAIALQDVIIGRRTVLLVFYSVLRKALVEVLLEETASLEQCCDRINLGARWQYLGPPSENSYRRTNTVLAALGSDKERGGRNVSRKGGQRL